MQAFSSSPNKVIIDTGSVFSYHTHHEMGSGYLITSGERNVLLCGNEEGWGPMSPDRYDFTPCFIDAGVAVAAIFGILAGTGAILHLLGRQYKPVTTASTHYWLKQSLLFLVGIDFVFQLIFQVQSYRGESTGDFRVWTTVLTLVSLCIVFTVQHVEHFRIRHANGVVLFYWLFLLVALSIKLHSFVSQNLYNTHKSFFAIYSIGYGFAWATFLVEWLWPRTNGQSQDYEAIKNGNEHECPVEYATIFSKLTFSWITPLMKYGYSVFLTEEDFWDLAQSDRSETTGTQFEHSWSFEMKKTHRHPSLWRVLFRAYGGPYMLAAIFKIGNDIAAFTQPQLLMLLLTWVDSHQPGQEPQPVVQGAAIAFAMFATACFQTAMIHQYFQLSFVTGMRIKSGLASAIYKKSLRLSNEGRAAKTTGDIVNFMAVDAQRLQDLTQFAQQIWSAPFQITICMISLYQLVGWSMLAGIGVMLVMIPINGFIARIMKNLQKKQMKNKDARSRLVAEIVTNMKSIKLYAWGSAFMNKLSFIRNEQELKTLRKIGAGQAFANFTWSSTPFLVSCSTFAVFALTGDEPLTTKIVFPALGECFVVNAFSYVFASC